MLFETRWRLFVVDTNQHGHKLKRKQSTLWRQTRKDAILVQKQFPNTNCNRYQSCRGGGSTIRIRAERKLIQSNWSRLSSEKTEVKSPQNNNETIVHSESIPDWNFAFWLPRRNPIRVQQSRHKLDSKLGCKNTKSRPLIFRAWNKNTILSSQV